MNDFVPVSETLKAYLRQLYSPSSISSILRREGIVLRKSFGQNFLINRDIVQRVIGYADLDTTDTVLEIGPGLGSLTIELAMRAKRVVAVEIDRGLYRHLETKIREFGIMNIELIHKDFMKMSSLDFSKIGVIDRMVSNLPYSIGIKAMLRVIEEVNSIRRISATVQKEMAVRLTAKPGKKEYAYTSVAVQSAGDITITEKSIAPVNFFPQPEVESSIVVIDIHRERPAIPDSFLYVVRAGFANRRKSLVNNLLGLKPGLSKEQLQETVKRLFHDIHIRAEQLSIEDFVLLAKHLDL